MTRTNTLHTHYEVWEYNPTTKRFGWNWGCDYVSIQDAKAKINEITNNKPLFERITKQGFKLVIVMQERTLFELNILGII